MTVDTSIDIKEELAPFTDTDDGEKHLSHIINSASNMHVWQKGMNATDIIEIARLTGQEIVALCGYRLIPMRDPRKYPACKTCVDIAANIMIGALE